MLVAAVTVTVIAGAVVAERGAAASAGGAANASLSAPAAPARVPPKHAAAVHPAVPPSPTTQAPRPTVPAAVVVTHRPTPVVVAPPATAARPVVVAAPGPVRAPAPHPVAVAAPAPAAVAPTSNPPSSIAPSQAFESACMTLPINVSSCNGAALADINQARGMEGLGALPLPGNFSSLGLTAQLMAVANAERTSRGLPAMPENAVLDTLAQVGALAGVDPSGPAGFGWASIYSIGNPTALAADFAWMYDDGPGSTNIDCTSANSSGCWGHRDNILSSWSGAAGAGVATLAGRTTLTMLFVENY